LAFAGLRHASIRWPLLGSKFASESEEAVPVYVHSDMWLVLALNLRAAGL
jgi:hypothetical protein